MRGGAGLVGEGGAKLGSERVCTHLHASARVAAGVCIGQAPAERAAAGPAKAKASPAAGSELYNG